MHLSIYNNCVDDDNKYQIEKPSGIILALKYNAFYWLCNESNDTRDKNRVIIEKVKKDW